MTQGQQAGTRQISYTNRTTERLDSDHLTRAKLVSGGQERAMYIVRNVTYWE